MTKSKLKAQVARIVKDQRVAEEGDKLTLDMLSRVTPKNRKGHVTQKHVDIINNAAGDKEELHIYRNNILGYISVLDDGRFKVENYINAVKYVSSKLLGSTNKAAYIKTFPDKYITFTNNGISEKDLASYVSAYNKTILVSKIMEQSMIPVHILNMDLHQQAINHLAYLMLNAKSEKVQSDSAGKLVDVLKPPETAEINLNIGLQEDDTIGMLRESTMALVAQQKAAMAAGVTSVKDIAHSKLVHTIIDVEVEEE